MRAQRFASGMTEKSRMAEGLVELACPGRCLREGCEELGPQPGESEYMALAGAPAVEAAFS